MAGCFITFEGTEGCGKSTHIKKLARRLEAEGHTVRTLREPGGTESGESIRHLLKHGPEELTAEAELLLMNASRAQLVREVIRPAIAAGEIVLCDRFYDSTTVYQGTGRGLDAAQVQAVIDFAVGDTRPDLTLLLQIPLKTSEERRARRSETDRFEQADRTFFERIEAGYTALAAAEPDRIRVIEADQPLDAVAAAIWRIVNDRLKK
ncbi:MAG TPA: dTMP kinase [Verrucomicrobiales bacterium]|nr:dTMP kinase [Verrucomicrobiales bacterium]|tara:strand:+ start:1948 stop:2568 length:621 start_codon:yes stop_codon:yes gene_type:complete